MFKLFRRKSTAVIDSSAKLAELLGAWYDADAGVQITPGNAPEISAVFSCIKVLTESIGMLPLNLFKELPGGGSEKATNHPLQTLLKHGPNDYLTDQEYKELIVAHLCLRGNHYSYINRTASGRVLELLPMAPDAVTPKLSNDYELTYDVQFKSGPVRTLLAEEVLHIRLWSLDGLTGLNPIQYNRHCLGLAKATEKHGSTLFAHGAKPSGVLSTDHALTDKQYERLKQEMELHRGVSNQNREMILDGGLKWLQVSMTAEDSQFLETRKFQRSEIAGFFRVPPHMIGDLERATFSNIEHQDLAFARHTLIPYCTRIEKRINKALLSDKERASHFAKFNINALMRGDMKTRSEYYTAMIQNGVMSPNEVRILEDMNPREGGDTYLTPLNMAVNGKPADETETH
ncbi:phage portal protein [Hahella sp. HN01]|uniref:phage portal protein n=1 Tax=Hahella sp. HN01 TaxID=2847262 RepID=UPI001C1ED6DA|nr:phage portal protein [Hahella sp. HN01]MBU6955756.1 phage portal protein [Hahella sp. HN01]